ncbi:hypothetical protein TSMEX_010677 [Taenia solium]|eukprot:TsM_000758500 transcript=TsM_000758500 gene=TsM_000758500
MPFISLLVDHLWSTTGVSKCYSLLIRKHKKKRYYRMPW